MKTDAARDRERAERKAQLLRLGEFYRGGVVHAKADVRQGMRTESLVHAVVDRAGGAVRARVDGLLAPLGLNLHALLPYAASAVTLLNRRKLFKPALGVGAALAAAAYFVMRCRRQAALAG